MVAALYISVLVSVIEVVLMVSSARFISSSSLLGMALLSFLRGTLLLWQELAVCLDIILFLSSLTLSLRVSGLI